MDWIFKLLSGESLACHWCQPHKHDYTWPSNFISLKWFLTQYQAKRNQAPFIAFTLYLCWTPQVFVHERAKQSRLVYYWDLTGCRVRTKRRNAATRTENSKLMSPQEHLCTRTILDRSWKNQSDTLYQTHSYFAEGWYNTKIQLSKFVIYLVLPRLHDGFIMYEYTCLIQYVGQNKSITNRAQKKWECGGKKLKSGIEAEERIDVTTKTTFLPYNSPLQGFRRLPRDSEFLSTDQLKLFI